MRHGDPRRHDERIAALKARVAELEAENERRTIVVKAPAPPLWDHKLPKSILSDYDLGCLVYAITSPMHYCSGIGSDCHDGPCAMCGNAVRLVVQAAEPRIIAAAIKRMAGALGVRNIDLNPHSHGDD